MKHINEKANNVVSFHGPMGMHVRTFFGSFIKVLVDFDYKTVNRLFKIFIELTQNVAYYSAKTLTIDNTEVGVGEFTLDEYENYFKFTTGNIILAGHEKKLTGYCEEINVLDKDSLRDLKREKRRQSETVDVGAHIGLIHVGLLTENDLEYRFEKIDDSYSYFYIAARVNKF